ncbi:LamG-like jellyroll fold domain-containing protein [Clostridium sp.]|uniref:LamG-like jellyroll fold domain-containing protein n=1 Tax=Clostridium sp. TaxID=1506 RepID=UPI003F3398B7
MRGIKRLVALSVLSCMATVSIFNGLTRETFAFGEDVNVLAEWKFEEESVKSGSITDKNLIFKDVTGNGNDIEINTYGNPENMNNYLEFTDEKMYDKVNGSLRINGDSKNKVGADFITVEDAPINKENFEEGYTIEFLYQLPMDWTASDSWMGLMARQGDSKSMDEPELGSMALSVSNCKEIQYLAANKNDDHQMNSAAWSVSMDKGGVWYHIVVTSDNDVIRTYVNGAEAFRDYVGDMGGLYADAEDGRFRIGSSWWKEGSQTLSKFGRGNYQQVRISEGALEKEDWLISNHEEYIGEYGVNDEFSLRDKKNYNMVFLPDTQNTIKFKGNVMNSAMDWLVENKNLTNVVSVTHLGDIVENGWDTNQWDTARMFNKLPQNDIKLLMQPGNHDSLDNYLNTFGKDSEYGILTSDYITRTSPSGVSSYMVVDAGSYKYLTLSVSIHNIDEDLPWVEEVLKNTNMPTIITSHDIQNCSDTVPNDIKLSTRGKKIWEVVKKYNQVFMMIGGHSHGAGDQVLKNDAGNDVFNILADYQFAYNGGNALFKFAEFDEKENKIYLSTFSPYAAGLKDEERTFFDVNYLTGAGNYSEFDIDFEERFEGMDKSEEDNIVVGKVEKLKESDVTSNSLILSWEAPKEIIGLVEYVIYKDGKKIDSISSKNNTYKVEGLNKNSIYGFKVTAKYSNGEESKPKSINVRTKK